MNLSVLVCGCSRFDCRDRKTDHACEFRWSRGKPVNCAASAKVNAGTIITKVNTGAVIPKVNTGAVIHDAGR